MEKSVLIKGDNYDISGILSYKETVEYVTATGPWNRSTEE